MQICWKNLFESSRFRWSLRFMKLAIFVLVLLFVYFKLVDLYELKASPRTEDRFDFYINTHENAKQCIELSTQYNSMNILDLNIFESAISGRLNFKLLCNISDESYTFNIYLTDYKNINRKRNIKTGILPASNEQRPIQAAIQNLSPNNIVFYFNSSNMSITERYQLSFDLSYEPKFFNKYNIRMENAVINQTIFVWGKNYICEENCFEVFNPLIKHYSIIPLEDNSGTLYTKRFDVTDSNLFISFSPKKRTWIVWSKIIDALVLGSTATFIYEMLIKDAFLLRNKKKNVYIKKRNSKNVQ